MPARRSAVLIAGVLAAVPLVALVAMGWSMLPRRGDATEAAPHRLVVANVLTRVRRDIDTLDRTLGAVERDARSRDVARARRSIAEARREYKRVEWLAEHYVPLTARALNGPDVATVDDENRSVVVPPTGLQVMDRLASSRQPARASMDSLMFQARVARVNLRRVRERLDESTITGSQLFDAARTGIARVVTLGIAGADSRTGDGSLGEAAESLDAIRLATSVFAMSRADMASFDEDATGAIAALRSSRSFAAFDRFRFIVDHANPLARRLGELQQGAGIPRLTDARAWRASANTVFDAGAFDPQAYAPPGMQHSTPALVNLGERLFNEPRLSGDGRRTCATCHLPRLAFADGRRTPDLPAGMSRNAAHVPRNTPTLLNAALQPSAFSDARVMFLEDQVTAVVQDAREMGGSLAGASAAVRSDPGYRSALEAAFGLVPAPDAMSRAVRSAIAAYVRSLVRTDSRVDRALRGTASLTASERRGLNLFLGKARCGTCHFAPLYGGTAPPGFTESEPEVIGAPAGRRSVAVDSDAGIGGVDGVALHHRAFRTPSLRNVAVTAPYMHNGVFATLEEVVDFYNDGGGQGRGARVTNQTLPADSLHLSRTEKRALVAFMRALTDTTTYTR